MDEIKKRARRACRASGSPVVSVWEAATGSSPEPKRQRPARQLDAWSKPKAAKPKRALEGDVQAAILSILWRHPGVAWAGRFNSGGFVDERQGKRHHYKFIRLQAGFAFPDIAGQLKDGRFFAIECKREGWKRGKCEREDAQEAFLKTVSANKGISGFATSVDAALGILGLGVRQG